MFLSPSRQWVCGVALLACVVTTAAFAPQSSASSATRTSATAAAVAGPSLGLVEQERFLKVADITSQRELSEGSTKSFRMTLSDGHLTHDAHFQPIDIYKPVWRGKDGSLEKNFRDTWKFNVAAYELSKLIGIAHMVPASVEREVDGRLGSMTWWADDVQMTELERRDKKVAVPATQDWVNQLHIVRVFDQLIYNTDRNQGNLLITSDWKVLLIDHTRAFRTQSTLQNRNQLMRCDYRLLQALRKLNRPALLKSLGPYLRAEEITAILARRDLIVRFFDNEVAQKGEVSVLTDLPRSTPQVSVP